MSAMKEQAQKEEEIQLAQQMEATCGMVGGKKKSMKKSSKKTSKKGSKQEGGKKKGSKKTSNKGTKGSKQ
jgi:hypothetical protein